MRQAFGRLWQLAVVGVGVSLALAGREIAKQEYLTQGLMRTSLEMTGRAAMAGLLLGAAAGLVLALLLRLRPWVAGRCSALGVLGEFLGKWVGRVPTRLFAGRFGRAAGAVVLLAAVGLWGAGTIAVHRARAEALERGLNVIVVSIDTLRADRASLLSGDERERDLTPNMRELLAARGTVFSKAIAQAPWTLPSVGSIFTGLYPKQHGAEHRTSVLPPGQLTVAEILREAGYRTLGVSSALYVTNASGLRQGFERFDESQARGQQNISSPRVTDKAIEFLDASAEEPFFLFVHYFDPHWAYRDHEEFDFAGWYDGWLSDISQRLKQDEFTQHLGTVRRRPRRQLLDPGELKYIRDLYDEEIAYTDAEVGRLLRYVRQAGFEKNSLVIMVADHGEEFLERGNLGHGETIWQEVVHVPMVIAGPLSAERSVVKRPVETRALFSTILDFLGVAGPSGSGKAPLLLLDPPDEAAMARSATESEVFGADGRMFPEPVMVWWSSIQSDRWKLIKEHLRGRELLYDLENDPGERRECSGEHPERRQELEAILDRMDAEVRAGAPSKPVPEADEEQMRRLKALGYL